MTSFRYRWVAFLTPRLAVSEACHALEQHRTTHPHCREPAQHSDALRPRN
ncbi:TPA: hypothetical protein ACGPHA_001564 [Klebsiella variicola]|nr:hypothetical protein [Klebsiella michiganensis]NRG23392.1 hypothetical protein [Klebsiella michiganensis]